MLSPLARRQARHNTQHGRKSEKRVARLVKAKLTINSGGTDRQKGDFRSDRFLYDAKATHKQSLAVTVKMLRTLSKQAWAVGKEPCITLSFVDGSGELQQATQDWALVPMSVLQELVG